MSWGKAEGDTCRGDSEDFTYDLCDLGPFPLHKQLAQRSRHPPWQERRRVSNFLKETLTVGGKWQCGLAVAVLASALPALV